MLRKLILTKDGSPSIEIPELNVIYHSIYGAIQESRHVFIKNGLLYQINHLNNKQIHIFEVGFGTGLNALLTLIEAEKFKQKIYYETVEPFPLDNEQIKTLNYCEQLGHNDFQNRFEQLHACEWEKDVKISEAFCLYKTRHRLEDFTSSKLKNLIYFDAFAPNAQPELWTDEIFQKIFSMLAPEGVLVTYCSKGIVRRAMQTAGLKVEKIPGPQGKREIIRATKMP